MTRLGVWKGRFALLAALASFFAGGFALFLSTCFATPPELESRPAILDKTLREDGARKILGNSWFLRRSGRSLLYLEGDPFTLGYSNAALTGDMMEEQERSLIKTVRDFFPSTPAFMAITTAVLVNNRSLPDYVSSEHQLEILGLSMGGEDPYPNYGPRYHRILNYHAAHDISHWVWDKYQPNPACTAFAATGEATLTGRLLVGRTFDFEAGRHFDSNKIIGLYRPQRGQAFLSVSWPGMAGAVTGINEQRIYCSINGAHSADKGRIGRPVSLVVREVLQYATTIDEAVAIVKAAEVYVTDGYLIADGKSGEAVVVEKTPARTEIRRMSGDVLLQANHFETPGLAGDVGNQAHKREGTTASRHARLAELVHADAESGILTPPRVAAILRDRRGPGGVGLALGNRGAINALIATHAVVADVTGGILWVSRGPHQLGVFDAYAIEGFGTTVAPAIPADPLLEGAYTDVIEARAKVEAARANPAANTDALRDALQLNPRDAEALLLLGQGLAAQGKPAEARRALEAAQAAHPPFAAQRETIADTLQTLP